MPPPRGKADITLDPTLYPELIADGRAPAASLLRAATTVGVTLPAVETTEWSTAPQGPVTLLVDTHRGRVAVELDRDHREIRIAFEIPWMGIAASAVIDTLLEGAEMMQSWQEQTLLADMSRSWPSLNVSPLARAHEEGRAVEHQWNEVRSLPSSAIETSLVETAYNTPPLRQLFPIVSHGCLTFSRCTLPPYSRDIPTVTPDSPGCWRVGGPLEPLSTQATASTAVEAISLVVQGLPPDCGKAVQGSADVLG